MELKTFLFVAACIAAFFIARTSGNKSKAILIPAGVAGVITMFPVLTDPKAYGFFGITGLLVFVSLATLMYSAGAALGCFAGLQMRSPSVSSQKLNKRQWLAIGILLSVVAIAVLQTLKEKKFNDLSNVAAVSGITFLQKQEEVLSKMGPIIQTSVFSKGHDSSGHPLIIFSVKGEQREGHVWVEVTGTKESPKLSIRSIELLPDFRKNK
ncbi:MAG: hypothetical protein Fur0026_07440 [Sideroxydans sp.]